MDAAKYQLQLVLGFFPRVESKASVVLAVNTGMLGTLAANLPSPQNFQWRMSIAVLPVALIAVSDWFLFRITFPNLKGGSNSLVYFRTTAERTEHKFIEEFTALEDDAYSKDILGQVWRNSEILSKKFDHLRVAFILMLVAIMPWLSALAVFVSRNNSVQRAVHP